MQISDLKRTLKGPSVGQEMHRLIEDLYPICRSITGNGVRQTMRKVQTLVPLEVHEVPSGTPVFDWTVPKEWNIRDAYIKNAQGERVVDFRECNLHVVSYSVPVSARLSKSELQAHVFTLPDHPDWIPYRTSYYQESWGFCLSHRRWLGLEEGEYVVRIDSSLEAGHLTYGELLLPGDLSDEVLITSHICHPSLCNDNLSGVAVVAFLARYLSQLPRRYSYRFLFIPGTIGSITWLSLNEAHASRIKHGLVVAGVGDAGRPTYKKSRRGDAEVDRAMAHVLRHTKRDHLVMEFVPYGYDERQFCSPGFNLPVGNLMRTPHGQYPEYHTSADDLNFVQPEALADSLEICLSLVEVLEGNGTYVNQNPKGEPQLGKRGLYRAVGGAQDVKRSELAMLWVLNYSDGTHSLLDIAERSGIEFDLIRHVADLLLEHNLLQEAKREA